LFTETGLSAGQIFKGCEVRKYRLSNKRDAKVCSLHIADQRTERKSE